MSDATLDAHPRGPGRLAATLRDVARAAGVSTASASRVLAGKGGVSKELHARIVAAASRLSYQTNLAARTLASRGSRLVAVVGRTLADPLIAGIVEALERGLHARGHGLLFATVAEPADDFVAAAKALLGRGADAFAFVGMRPIPGAIDLLAARDLPWLEVSDGPGRGALSIDIGRRRGGVLAGRYLLDLGHRRCGVIARPDGGTREGLATAAQSDATLLLSDAPLDGDHAEAARAAMRELLKGSAPPTAVVCGSDADGLAAMRECSMHGRAVPREMSIIGFGDTFFARHVVPSLTTIRISPETIGAQGAEMLVAALEGRESPQFEAAVKLVVRESTAAV